MKKVTVVMIQNERGRYLLGQRKDNKKWTPPVGTVENGETPIEGANRELKKKANLDLDLLLVTGARNKDKSAKVYLYEGFYDGDQMASSENDPDEKIIQWEWVSPSRLEKLKNELHVPFAENVFYRNLIDPVDFIDRLMINKEWVEAQKGKLPFHDEKTSLYNKIMNLPDHRMASLYLGIFYYPIMMDIGFEDDDEGPIKHIGLGDFSTNELWAICIDIILEEESAWKIKIYSDDRVYMTNNVCVDLGLPDLNGGDAIVIDNYYENVE